MGTRTLSKEVSRRNTRCASRPARISPARALCPAKTPSGRRSSSEMRPPSSFTGMPASPKASTRGASRPARISPARAHPASMDVEIRASRRVQILRAGPVHRNPVRCADARRCSEQSTRAESNAGAPSDIGIIQSRHSRRIVPMTRSQIAFALGLENGERSTARPNARIESSRCRAKMLSRSWMRYW